MMRAMAPLLLIGLLAGCERAKQDMYDQPRYKPYAASPLFADGASARPLPSGTVPHARGAFGGSTGGRVGTAEVRQDLQAEAAQAQPYPVDMQLLRRGQERFSIYCVPCHSPAGDGDGMVVRRGFPSPPTFHSERLRAVPDRHLYDVITQGYGIMYPYADRIEPQDRWAVVAYIRALQLSQHAEAAHLPDALRARLPARLPASRGQP
jgi:mono/diheme cytochrome c family protein